MKENQLEDIREAEKKTEEVTVERACQHKMIKPSKRRGENYKIGRYCRENYQFRK